MPAYGAAIPGATYSGVASNRGTVTFTVSADGTIIQSFAISPMFGMSCEIFVGAANVGEWPGAPIVDNAFDYEAPSLMSFKGTFSGAQSATGTIELTQPGPPPECDTGVVTWTASTTATPPPPGGGNGNGNGGGNGGGGKGGGGKHQFASHVVLRKVSPRLYGGHITSVNRACATGRKVVLWRGARRIATTKSKAGGKFSFVRSPKVHGLRVRASVAARAVKAGICMAGSSTFIAG